MKLHRRDHTPVRRLAALASAAALVVGVAACETDDATADDPIDDEIREDTGDADLDEGEPGVDDDLDADTDTDADADLDDAETDDDA